jgi:hypothetical protein
MNVVGQKPESLSNCGIKRNAGHHHMFVIVGTLTSDDHQQNCKYSIFCKKLESPYWQHMKKKKLKSIKHVL